MLGSPAPTGGGSLAGSTDRPRPGDPLFERFSDRGREVIVAAQEEAVRLGHSYIGSEHLLLGVARQARSGLPGDITIERLRAQVVSVFGRGEIDERTPQALP